MDQFGGLLRKQRDALKQPEWGPKGKTNFESNMPLSIIKMMYEHNEMITVHLKYPHMKVHDNCWFSLDDYNCLADVDILLILVRIISKIHIM